MSLALHTFDFSMSRRNYNEGETPMEKITLESIPIIDHGEEIPEPFMKVFSVA
jgi:hypothetical protein